MRPGNQSVLKSIDFYKLSKSYIIVGDRTEIVEVWSERSGKKIYQTPRGFETLR